jgi:hypothetical protein
MGRLLWPLGLLVAFGFGMAAGALPGSHRSTSSEVARLRQQVDALSAELRTRDERRVDAGSSPGPWPGLDHGGRTRGSAHRTVAAATADDLDASSPPEPRGEARPGRPAGAPGGRPAPASPIDAALERFYLYFDDPKSGGSGWERWRQLAEDLRGMGAAATEALMRVLSAGTSSDERRAAARLLGELRAPEALPLLQDVLDRDADVLLRRDAAMALRRLGAQEAAPYMESLIRNSREDRFVRLSAASGLAQLGKSQGVSGLVKIFEESEADGRGRDLAFRALRSQKDEGTLAFMRDLVTSDAEVMYRLQAIRFLKGQGDQRALPALERLMQSPSEQPSIREAAAQARAAILSK